MTKLKALAIVGDPLYSSTSHIVRLVKIFSYVRKSLKADTYVFTHDKKFLGETVKGLLDKAVHEKDITQTLQVEIPEYGYFNLNNAKSIPSYTEDHRVDLQNEVVQKLAYVNKLAEEYEQVLVICSPGFLGNWYMKPAVAENVKSCIILDTAYNPYSELNLGTSWKSNSFLGSLQNIIFDRKIYSPMLATLNSIRKNLGLRFINSRKEMYQGWVLDPSVKGYSKLSKELLNYRFIGPLLPKEMDEAAADEILTEIKTFKKDSRLIYFTFGGSAKGGDYVKFLADMVKKIVSEYDNVKFIVTSSDVFDHQEELAAYLPLELRQKCLLIRFLDTRVATKYADLTVGVLGKEQVLMSIMNDVPVIALPVNIDQATHEQLIKKLQIGEAAINNSIVDLAHSSRLIKNVFSSVDKIYQLGIKKILENGDRYHNAELRAEILSWTPKSQALYIKMVIKQILLDQ